MAEAARTLLVVLALAAPGAALAEADARSFDETMAWLEEQVKLHGKMYGEDVGGKARNPRWFVYRVNAWGREPCKMTVSMQAWDLDENYRTKESHPLRDRVQSSRGTFGLGDVRPDEVTAGPLGNPKFRAFDPKTRAPVECVGIPLKRDAMKLTGSLRRDAVFTYSRSDLCVTEKGLAERIAAAVRHLARLCGA